MVLVSRASGCQGEKKCPRAGEEEGDTLTHSSTQCPAVATQYSLMRAPPHRCVEVNPKKDVRLTET